jgi:hypothetical protein
VGPAGLGLEWSQGCRFPNIGFPLADGDGGWHGKVSEQADLSEMNVPWGRGCTCRN